MASLEKRYDGRYRFIFCWQAERRYHSLGSLTEREARASLRRVCRRPRAWVGDAAAETNTTA